MSDSILDQAIADRDAERARAEDYERKAEKARARAEELTVFIRMYQEYTGSAASGTPVRRAEGALSQTAFVAEEIIERLGRPVPTTEMKTLLEESGIHVGGKEPLATLSARLSRADNLVNIRQRGWWIKGKADDAFPAEESSSASTEVGTDGADEPPAQGREAGPGGGT